MFVAQTNYNKIFIIEALPDGEPRTGRRLYDDVISFLSLEHGFANQYCYTNSKGEYQKIMDSIQDECKNNGILPFISFDIHGYAEGIKFPSNEVMGWQEFGGILREVNIITNNNLMVLMSSCFGVNAIKSMAQSGDIRLGPRQTGLVKGFDCVDFA